MLNNFEDIQKFTAAQIEAATAKSATFAQGLERMASETTNFSKAQFDSSAAAMRKLAGTKSIGEAITIQTEYAKSAYEALVEQTNKVSEIFKSLAKDGLASLEATVSTSVEAAKPAPVKIVK
jgi:phasin family protein